MYYNIGGNMVKESRHRKNDKKKATMTLKERRAKKHEKQQARSAHVTDEVHHDPF